MVTTTLIILGLILAIIGLIGCVLPIIPGPVLSFLSLVLLSFAKGWEPFSAVFWIVMAGLMILVSVLDYIFPAVGAKKSGATKAGMWLSIIGMIIGIFVFPPWGMFIGAFIGGVTGEIISGRKGKEALRVGWGIFWGNMVSIGLKLAYSSMVIFFYIQEMIS
ncbi:MAG: DUF456 domain-containing protein [Deltaproteobacteria bacterium]|nr:DUF456 domain-containing protein [Deltaproteobacteria bacterium]